TVLVRGKKFNGTIVVWVDPDGKSSLFKKDEAHPMISNLVPAARKILEKEAAILAPDVFLTGEFKGAEPMAVNARYSGYTFCYNRSLLAQRVHDILTAVAYARGEAKQVHLMGLDKAGPWVVLARALCGDKVGRTVADLNRFRFDAIKSAGDEMML